jgi:hypothetical protein
VFYWKRARVSKKIFADFSLRRQDWLLRPLAQTTNPAHARLGGKWNDLDN